MSSVQSVTYVPGPDPAFRLTDVFTVIVRGCESAENAFFLAAAIQAYSRSIR